MKKLTPFIGVLACALVLVGCNKKSMDYIIQHEPSIIGIVTEVYDNYMIIHCEQIDGYPQGADCQISLDVENKDSYTHVRVGDEVFVYYNGAIAESDPLQIQTVYAITLKTPVSRGITRR